MLKYHNPQRNQTIKSLHSLEYTVLWNVVMKGNTKLKYLDLKTLCSPHTKVINCSSFSTVTNRLGYINGGGFCEWFRCRSVEASFLQWDAASLGDTHRPMMRHLSFLRWLMQLNYDIQRPCGRPLRHRFSWFSSVLIKNFSWFHNFKLILYASHEAPPDLKSSKLILLP